MWVYDKALNLIGIPSTAYYENKLSPRLDMKTDVYQA